MRDRFPNPGQGGIIARRHGNHQVRALLKRSAGGKLIRLRQGDRRNAKLLGNTRQRFAFQHFVCAPPDPFVRGNRGDVLLVQVLGSRRANTE